MRIEARQLVKSFMIGGTMTPILKGIDLQIETGEFVVLSGKSGAGKSTLLYQLSLLSRPTSGNIFINDHSMNILSDQGRSQFRLKHFGFVFQDFALSRDLNAVQNVALPLLCLGLSWTDAFRRAEDVLGSVNLSARMNSYPEQLSGGEQQRVAIARAIVAKPQILFADEPTASLDSVNSEHVLGIIKKLHEKYGMTVVMITHEEIYKGIGDRIVTLEDGRLV